MLIGVAMLGLFIGALTGFVGAGGGILAIPALVYLIGVPLNTAISTSLLLGAVSPIAALVPRIRQHLIDWPIVGIVAIAGIPSAFAGTAVGKIIPQNVVLLAFAGLMIVAGIQMLRPRPEPLQNKRPRSWVLRALTVGLVVGFLTGLFGVGGGFIIIPALVLTLDIPIAVAIGTSLSVALVNTLAGLIAHAGTTTPDWTIALAFAIPSMVGAFLTARLAHRVSGRLLQRSLAILVLAVACLTVTEVVIQPGVLTR